MQESDDLEFGGVETPVSLFLMYANMRGKGGFSLMYRYCKGNFKLVCLFIISLLHYFVVVAVKERLNCFALDVYILFLI